MTRKNTLLGLAGLLTALCVIITVKYPAKSKNCESAEFTFAISHQDMPSGVYYDRQFDWPTGETLWLDIPVVTVEQVLLGCAAFVVWRAFKPIKKVEQSN